MSKIILMLCIILAVAKGQSNIDEAEYAEDDNDTFTIYDSEDDESDEDGKATTTVYEMEPEYSTNTSNSRNVVIYTRNYDTDNNQYDANDYKIENSTSSSNTAILSNSISSDIFKRKIKFLFLLLKNNFTIIVI